MKNFKSCSVIGLGYIGLPSAAVIADSKFEVIGVDLNPIIVNTVNNGETHIVEPNLDVLVKKVVQKGYLKAQTKPSESDVFLIAVPTPFKKKESNMPEPNTDYVMSAIDSIISVLKPRDLIIIESTCPVGTTSMVRNFIAKKINFDINQVYIAYCPERVIPGNIIKELINNDRVIGGINTESGEAAKRFYLMFCKGEILITDDKTAEMVKLTENAFRDVNIAFANELSMISDELNINIDELIALSNHHPRVNILNSGCGVGGHCIAVDPWFIASRSPNKTPLIQTARRVNDNKMQWVVNKITEKSEKLEFKIKRKPIIGILGLAYKSDVDDLRESPAVKIANQLICNGEMIKICEPYINNHDTLEIFSLEEVLNKSDFVVALVAHKMFKKINLDSEKFLDFCGIF
tara:strand:- start:1113 stop:2327 length:1215 start_codon:yes stop_codon:yes gene_type:complete